MATQSNSTFGLKSWDEKTWDGKDWKEVEGPRQTHAVVVKTYEGDIIGEGTTHMVMTYQADGTAVFTGLEKIVGRLGDRSGSFVLLHNGVYEDGFAKGNWTVVRGSGTGDLQGLKGKGSSEIGHGDTHPFLLEYAFE